MSLTRSADLPLDIPFLRDVPAAARADFLNAGRVMKVPAGRRIMTQGDPAGDFMILLKGRLRVSATTASGRDLTFRLLDAIQPVGEVAALDGGPRTADVAAVGPCQVLVLPRQHCLDVIGQHPALALAMVQLLCARLRDTSQGLERVATQRLPSRMAHLLARLAQEYGQPLPGGGVALPMRLSQGDMASLVAATREAVNKQLAEWKAAGWLVMEAGHMTIADPLRLAAECD